MWHHTSVTPRSSEMDFPWRPYPALTFFKLVNTGVSCNPAPRSKTTCLSRYNLTSDSIVFVMVTRIEQARDPLFIVPTFTGRLITRFMALWYNFSNEICGTLSNLWDKKVSFHWLGGGVIFQTVSLKSCPACVRGFDHVASINHSSERPSSNGTVWVW